MIGGELVGSIWRRLGRLQWPIIWAFFPKYNLGVNAYITDDQGRLWLQKHRMWPHQEWGLPGGMVDGYEDLEPALRRELREELGAEVDELHLVVTAKFYHRGLSICYETKFRTIPVDFDHRELLEVGFFELDHLPTPIRNSHRQMIEAMQNRHS